MRVIGLLSGTSADGVDAAAVEWPEGEAASPFELLAFHEEPFAAGRVGTSSHHARRGKATPEVRYFLGPCPRDPAERP